MNIKQYRKAGELLEIIHTTEEGLAGLISLQSKRRELKESRSYDDGQYCLNIGEYSDGTGEANANLTRYEGNAELLDIIINTLVTQLERFKEEFNKL